MNEQVHDDFTMSNPPSPPNNNDRAQLPRDLARNPPIPAIPWMEQPMYAAETAAMVQNATRKAGQDNTKLAYDSKIIEFKQYCQSVFEHEGTLAEIVTKEKAFGFVLFNAYCPKKRADGRKKRGDGNVLRFDLSEYNDV